MFVSMAILSLTVLIFSEWKDYHLKWVSLVSLLYCLFIHYTPIFTLSHYIISSLILLCCSGYYMVLFEDKVKSFVFLFLPFVFKLYEFLLTTGLINLKPLFEMELILNYLFNSDYFLLSSILLFLTLNTTRYNITDFEIKDFRSLIILIVYTACTINIIV